jgi:hypothetical protein
MCKQGVFTELLYFGKKEGSCTESESEWQIECNLNLNLSVQTRFEECLNEKICTFSFNEFDEEFRTLYGDQENQKCQAFNHEILIA